MKKISVLVLVLVFSVSMAWAQDDVQDISKRIIRLAAQRDYNNSLILDLNRKALDIDNEIRRLQMDLQELLDAKEEKATSE